MKLKSETDNMEYTSLSMSNFDHTIDEGFEDILKSGNIERINGNCK
jgi:hypothetical protein